MTPDAWTRTCTRCGAPNPEQANFCMACAQSLTGSPPAPALVRQPGAVSTTAGTRHASSDGSEARPSLGAWAARVSAARFTSRTEAAGTITPPSLGPGVAAATMTHADATPAAPANLDDRTVALPPPIDAPSPAPPAVSEDRTVMFDPDLQAPETSDDRTVMFDPGSEAARGSAPVAAPDDHTVMLDARVHTPGAGTPAAPEDRTVLFQPGTQTPSGSTPARSLARSGGLSRMTPRSGISRLGTPFGSRMSVLSSLADADSPAPLAEGLEIADRYRVKSLIGKGGMGVVYLVDDLELDREIALKVIRSDIAASPESLERFKREIQLSSKVTHPNVLRVYDLGESEGVKFLTMQYVQGEDLSNIVKRDGRLTFDRVMNYFKQICAGLGVAHEQGVIHRDLKPQNVMIDPTDRVLLTDFGLATVAEASSAAKSGSIMGTPYYMSPEQVRGEELDQRSDIYALGIMLYELLTGAIPFIGGNVMDVMKRRLAETPRPIGELNPDLPAYIRKVIDKCLATDREQRYASCDEILRDIYDATEGRRRRRQAAAIMSLAALLVVGVITASGWYIYEQKRAAALKDREPVSVLIADVQNGTADSTFNRTLEPMVKLALEDAGFIHAYARSDVPRLGIALPDTLDERAAMQLAVKQGIGVVVSGSIQRRGSMYAVSLKATHPVTGQVMTGETKLASRKDQVLQVTTNLVTSIRQALGDRTSDAAQELAMRNLSTTSLEVARHYAAATEAQSKGNFEEAAQSFEKAVQLDPKFGLGYQGLAVMSGNLGRLQDAEKYASEALRHLDGMTERERFQTRGSYYSRTGDYRQCVKEYSEMIARYPADVLAHNQRSLCLVYLRDMRGAVDAMRQAVRILPNQTFYRINLALLLAHASDFAGAEREIRSLKELDTRAVGTLAFSQLGQGRVKDAAETYKKLSTMSGYGASFAAAGLADIAVYEGRFSEAVRLFEKGTAADLANKNADAAAMKFTSLAYAQLAINQRRLAAAAAEKALQNSTSMPIRFLAARILLETGNIARARELANRFSTEVADEPQAYAKLIEGGIALKNGDARQAIKSLTEANQILDTWLGHFDLGRAFFEAKAFPQADSEFDRCLQRRGEALALVFEDPTYGHLPIAYYYMGRVREELKTGAFADSYREYLKIRGQSTEDLLLPEVRRRAGSI